MSSGGLCKIVRISIPYPICFPSPRYVYMRLPIPSIISPPFYV